MWKQQSIEYSELLFKFNLSTLEKRPKDKKHNINNGYLR